MTHVHASDPARREVLSLLGATVGLRLFSGAGRGIPLLAALQAPSGTRTIAFDKGAIVRTILADLAPEALKGDILFHEHLDGVYSRDTRQLKLPPPSTADIAPVVADIKEAMKTGLGCVVDGGHPDMGVNYEHLKQISQQTGLQVVASGGYYIQNTYPAEVSAMSEDALAESLVKEAATNRYGAYGEIGDMPDEATFTPDERKVFRAVGKAHLKNNLPIFTHNNYGTGPRVPRDIALRQLDVYESVGVNPRRMAIGHVDSLPGKDPDIMKGLAKRGAFVGIDRVRGDAGADLDRVALVLGFLEAGYVDHLLLSSDTRKDFGRVARFFAQLQAAGVSDAMRRTILVDNPRRFLAFVPKTA